MKTLNNAYVNNQSLNSNKQVQIDRESFGIKTLRSILWIVYCIFDFFYSNRKQILSVLGKAIAVTVMCAVFALAFFTFGEMEHQTMKFSPRLGAALLQSTMLLAVALLGKNFVVEFIQVAKDILKRNKEDRENGIE